MPYPGRRLPYTVHKGKPGEPDPLKVSYLSKGAIILNGGRRISGEYELRQEIPYVENGVPWENEDLFSKLVELNTQGIPFEYQPPDMGTPPDLMAWWQEIGKLKESFKEFSWRSSHRWYLTVIEPPVLGVLGWEGPKPFGS